MGMVSYQGRIIVRDGEKIELKRTDNGLFILGPISLVESHQQQKSRVKKDPRLKRYLETDRAASTPDDGYIDVQPSWHRLTIFGDKAEELALEPGFNKGALLTIINASYSEEEPWKMKDDSIRAGRPETIGDKNPKMDTVSYPASVTIKFAASPKEGQPPFKAIWDGESPVAAPGGGGGGNSQYGDGSVAEGEGF